MSDNIDKSTEDRLKALGIIEGDVDRSMTDAERIRHLERGLQKAVGVIMDFGERLHKLEKDVERINEERRVREEASIGGLEPERFAEAVDSARRQMGGVQPRTGEYGQPIRSRGIGGGR